MRRNRGTDRGQPAWRRSSYSGANGGQCVEVADLGSAVGIRDSKNQAGPALELSHAEFAAFIRSVKARAFDLR
jgi:Domain of unknown function (DUF397).